MSEIPQCLAPLVLLLILLTITVRRPHPRYNIAVYAATIFLTPMFIAPVLENLLNLQPVAIHIITVAMITPMFFLLDHSLRQNTIVTQLPMKKKEGIYISGTCVSLLVLVGVIILISFIVNSRVLLYTSLAFFSI